MHAVGVAEQRRQSRLEQLVEPGHLVLIGDQDLPAA